MSDRSPPLFDDDHPLWDYSEGWKTYCKECYARSAREAGALERLVQMVREAGGLSTGHAATAEQLMEEVLWQVKELRKAANMFADELERVKQLLINKDGALPNRFATMRDDAVARIDYLLSCYPNKYRRGTDAN